MARQRQRRGGSGAHRGRCVAQGREDLPHRVVPECARRIPSRGAVGARHGAVGLAVSQENVELVKAAIDAVNREDWNALLPSLAPSFELDMSRAIGPIQGHYGRDELRRFLVEFIGSWEALRI